VEALAAGLGRQVREAIECLRAGFEAATHFYAFRREHWHRIRSTNGLEPLHAEITRWTRAVGAFPDRASSLPLITAVTLRVTAMGGRPLREPSMGSVTFRFSRCPVTRRRRPTWTCVR